MGGNK